MKNYSYIGISFIILVFGIWSVPKIVDKFSNNELSYLLDINEEPRKYQISVLLISTINK